MSHELALTINDDVTFDVSISKKTLFRDNEYLIRWKEKADLLDLIQA